MNKNTLTANQKPLDFKELRTHTTMFIVINENKFKLH